MLGSASPSTLQVAVAAIETAATYAAAMGIAIKGRGSTSHLAGRFESTVSEAVDDGWAVDESEEFLAPRLRTEVRAETARSIITRNNSPDVGFSQSVNPYRGCEHGINTP